MTGHAMFGAETSMQLRELLARSLIHFAENTPDITEPPSSLDETLQHGAASGGAAPFHFALFPEIVRFKTLERSFSSTLGTTFEEAARILGAERFATAERQYNVEGRIRATAAATIDQVIKDYETLVSRGVRVRTPDAQAEHSLLEELLGPGGEDHREIVDLFLRGSDGREHYFHMKTVKPNRDQSNKAKRLMLRVYALRFANRPQVFFGMAYNPYGEGNPYRWWPPRPYFDFAREVLIGKQFWDYIGGPGVFEQFMTLAMDVGKDVHDQVVDELGL